MNLTNYADNIELKDGIWYAKTRSAISYPEQGNDECFQLEDSSFWFQHRNACIISLIKKFPPEGAFFDIGGGNGFVAQAIERAGYQTVLVEPGERGVVNARKRALQNLVCSTLEDSQFKSGSIAAAGAFDVVEHIEDDVAFLKSLNKYLKPDGRLYLTVPAFNFLWSNEDSDGGHFRRYTMTGLSKKLIACGFQPEYSTYIFSILPLPIFLSRTIPSKLGIKKGLNPKVNHREHANKPGIAGKMLEQIWNWELQQIESNRTIPFGGSVLVVARKK